MKIPALLLTLVAATVLAANEPVGGNFMPYILRPTQSGTTTPSIPSSLLTFTGTGAIGWFPLSNTTQALALAGQKTYSGKLLLTGANPPPFDDSAQLYIDVASKKLLLAPERFLRGEAEDSYITESFLATGINGAKVPYMFGAEEKNSGVWSAREVGCDEGEETEDGCGWQVFFGAEVGTGYDLRVEFLENPDEWR